MLEVGFPEFLIGIGGVLCYLSEVFIGGRKEGYLSKVVYKAIGALGIEDDPLLGRKAIFEMRYY